MNIGVFLLIEPFASVEVQLQKAKEMGFEHADITDTNSGGSMLGIDFGSTGVIRVKGHA